MTQRGRRPAARPGGRARLARVLVLLALQASSSACLGPLAAAGPSGSARSFATLAPTPAAVRTGAPVPATAPAPASATPVPATTTTSPSGTPTAAPSRSLDERLGCAGRRGTLTDVSYQSAVAAGVARYRLYLPPCFSESGRRYPYLVLMHGSVADETEWTDALGLDEALDAEIAAGRLSPMIVVMPYGGELANYDLFTPGRSFDDVVVTEIMRQVERQWCGWGSPRARAIGGISRGGFWALEIGLRRPSLFAAIGGHSPFLYPEAGGPANNPLLLAGTARLAADGPPRIWIDAGAQDYALAEIEAIAATIRARNANLEYHLYPTGLHEEGYWRSHVAAYLAFYGRTWPRDVAALPACHA